MSTTDTKTLDSDDRAALLAAAEELAQPDGPLLDRRDEEAVEKIEAMHDLVA
jgi:hypothetical protein